MSNTNSNPIMGNASSPHKIGRVFSILLYNVLKSYSMINVLK